MSVPVVDFSACSLREKHVTEEQMHDLSKELKTAFMQIGFVFLKNTGINQEEVNHVMDISKKFFLQPDEQKQPFERENFAFRSNHGWVPMEKEWLNFQGPGDLKEAFNISSFHPDIKWPSGDLADFKEICTSFFLRCKELGLRVLRLLARSMDLDPEVFLDVHRFIGTDENGTTLRTLYYPPVSSESVKEGQLRCGEHSDFGTITLLFQSSDGLQVRRRSGEFIDVPVIPGTVLINIADLMQRLTSDHFISVAHRVLLPPAGNSDTRQSLAFFFQPDNDAQITCLDGSNKYPPVTGLSYLKECLNLTY